MTAPAPPLRHDRARWHVAVVGGGITGLAAAWQLRRTLGDAVRVSVLEASERLGGKLALHEVGGLTLDAGAESLLARRPEAVELAREVGLADLLVHPDTTSAYLWSRGWLHPLPVGSVMGVPTDLRALAASGVLHRSELARIPLDAWLPQTPSGPDVAVGTYVARRLGRAVVDRLVDPLLGGVYAGSAYRLSLAATIPALAHEVATERSVLVAAGRVRQAVAGASGPVFAGLRGGVGQLPPAVAAASGADVLLGTTVRAMARRAHGWRLEVGSAAELRAVDADAVVLAVPARPASRLLEATASAAAAELGHVDYASVALVTFAFPSGDVGPLPAGSGLLVPAVERRYVKAATFTSAKWGWVRDAAPELTVVRVSVGRHHEEKDLQYDDAELAMRALTDLSVLVPVPGQPLGVAVTRWGGGLPQYAVGHLARIARVRRAVSGDPTLALAGAAFDGVGVPACIASGRAAARQVVDALTAGQQGMMTT